MAGRAPYTVGLGVGLLGECVDFDLNAACVAAENAATAAEKVISDFVQSGQWSVSTKSDESPVTEVDVAAEQAIKSVLLSALPLAAFYGEETGHSASQGNVGSDSTAPGLRWLVDPIDGTKSFIRGMPFYSTQIALELDGQLIVGVSNAPAYRERVVAIAEQGTRLNDQSITVRSEITRLEDAFLSSGNLTTLALNPDRWLLYGELVSRARRVRGYGDFCHYHQLCCGQTDLIIESDVNILDIAALTVAVRSAGGIITDLEGLPINEKTTSVLAAGSCALHSQVLELLRIG